jgi:hypothetical protein
MVVTAENCRPIVDLGSRLRDLGDVVNKAVWIWIMASV